MIRLFADIVWIVQNGFLQFMKKTCPDPVSLINLSSLFGLIEEIMLYSLIYSILWCRGNTLQKNVIPMYCRLKDIQFDDLTTNDKNMRSLLILPVVVACPLMTRTCVLVLSVVVACPPFRLSSTIGMHTRWAARDENTCTWLIFNKRTVPKIKALDRRSSVSYRGKLLIRHSILSTFWPPRWLIDLGVNGGPMRPSNSCLGAVHKLRLQILPIFDHLPTSVYIG